MQEDALDFLLQQPHTKRQDGSEEKEEQQVGVSAKPERVGQAVKSKGVAPAAKSAAAVAVATGAPKSAAARLAERRLNAAKSARPSASMITSEHYSYVRKDLIFILILASIMFAAIIIMHFIPAIGG